MLLFGVLSQYFATMIAVVAAHVVASDRSTPPFSTGRLFIQPTLARDSLYAIVLGIFRIKKILGRTETRTRQIMYCQ